MYRKRDSRARELRDDIAGDVLDDPGDLARYCADASVYRHVPRMVVLPRSTDDIETVMGRARHWGIPVTARGAGTSVGGQAVGSGIVVDCSKHLDRILEVDAQTRTAAVQPGVVLDHLRRIVSSVGLTFGPDPSTSGWSTVGGAIGNNACGAHSLAWGRTVDNIVDITVLTADGTTMRLAAKDPAADSHDPLVEPGDLLHELRCLAADNAETIRAHLGRFSRQGSGYGLENLLPENGFDVARALAGTEGSWALTLAATLRLVRLPEYRCTVVIGFSDLASAADHADELKAYLPLAIEGMDASLVKAARPAHAARQLPDGLGLLFIEVGGDDHEEVRTRADTIARSIHGSRSDRYRVVTESTHQQALWRLRSDAAGRASRQDDAESWPGWEDAAVPTERLGPYLRDFADLLYQHDLSSRLFGHFGEGCVHARMNFDLRTARGLLRFRSFLEDASDLVASHGGTLSGEHGDGQARSELLRRIYPHDVVDLFVRAKEIWDPAGLLNPHVIVNPRPLDADIRLLHSTKDVATKFSYPKDGGNLGLALDRCVGLGRCRAADPEDVMCPSFQVTRDERHSTRGRARTLAEALRTDGTLSGMRSRQVREVLDLCLGCKACQRDCSAQVDMATYKAEFLHHHYRRRIRPRTHYSLGWLPVILPVAALVPDVWNAATAQATVSKVLKVLAGIDDDRALPQLASKPFHRAVSRYEGAHESVEDVALFVDTFTNFFEPDIARSAIRVLGSLGYRADVPTVRTCCGLTWLSTGQLGVARRMMRRTVASLAPSAHRGQRIVGLEPSCTHTLREELPRLLHGNRDAQAVAAAIVPFTSLVSESEAFPMGAARGRRAITQIHCHEYAAGSPAKDLQALDRLGFDGVEAVSGCCGLAGNFGFERGHRWVSQALAERRLFPAIRQASDEAVIIANGFSCRTQIRTGMERSALHIAQVLDQLIDVDPDQNEERHPGEG